MQKCKPTSKNQFFVGGGAGQAAKRVIQFRKLLSKSLTTGTKFFGVGCIQLAKGIFNLLRY